MTTAPDTGRDTAAEAVLIELVTENLDDVVDRMVSGLATAAPTVAGLGPEFVEGVRERSRMLLQAIVALMTSGESLEVLGPVIEQGLRERREQRIPQDLLFEAYRFLQQEFFLQMARVVQPRPDGQRMLAALAVRQLEFQWVVSRRGAAAYENGEAPAPISREESQQAVLEELVGLREGRSARNEHGVRYGLLLPLDTVAVTVRLGSGGRPGERLDPRIQEIARYRPWSVVGEFNGRAVYVGRGTIGPLPVVWGSVALPPGAEDSAAEITALVARAAATADAAERLGRASGEAEELALFTAVAALPEEEREAFLRRTFGPLRESGAKGDPVLDAVAAVGRFGNRREAAEFLHVHINTLDARMARFRELTGLDLADTVQRLRCDLGLFLLGRLR